MENNSNDLGYTPLGKLGTSSLDDLSRTSTGTDLPTVNKRVGAVNVFADDVAEKMYQSQSGAAQLWNGLVGRLVFTAAFKLVEGVGFLGAMGTELYRNGESWENYWSDVADNSFSKIMADNEQVWKDKVAPIYKSSNYGNLSLGRKLFDTSFWMDEAVDGAAFFLSALIPGTAVGKIGWGVKAATALNKALLGAGELSEMALKVGTGLAKTLPKLDRLSMAAVMSAQEGLFEGKDTRDSIISDLMTRRAKGEVNPTTGQAFTDQQILDRAAVSTAGTVKSNLAALMFSNWIESGWILKAGGAKTGIAKVLGEEMYSVGKNVEGLAESVVQKGVFNRPLGQALKGVVMEGLYEENIQQSIQNVNQAKARTGAQVGSTYAEALKDFINPSSYNQEKWESIFLGGLMGFIGGGAMRQMEMNREKSTMEKGVKQQNISLSALLEPNKLYKREEPTELNLKQDKDEAGNDVFSLTTKKGSDISKQDLTSEEFTAKTKELDLGPTGGTKVIDGQKVIDKDGKPVYDQQKVGEYLVAKQYHDNLLSLIESEENKDNSDQEKLKIYRNQLFIETAKAHFQTGEPDDFYNTIQSWKTMDPKWLEATGYEYNNVDAQGNRVSPEQFLDRKIQQAKDLHKIWETKDLLVDQAYVKKADRVQQLQRGELIFDKAAQLYMTKDVLADVDKGLAADKEHLLTNMPEKDRNNAVIAMDINSKINQYNALLSSEEEGNDVEKQLDALESSVHEAKKMYNEQGNNIKEGNLDKVLLESEFADTIDKGDIKHHNLNTSLSEIKDEYNNLLNPRKGLTHFKDNYIQGDKVIDPNHMKELEQHIPLSKNGYLNYESRKLRRLSLSTQLQNVTLEKTKQIVQAKIENLSKLSGKAYTDEVIGIVTDLIRNKLRIGAEQYSELLPHVEAVSKDVDSWIKEADYLRDSDEAEYKRLEDLFSKRDDLDSVQQNIQAFVSNKNEYIGKTLSRSKNELRLQILDPYFAKTISLNTEMDNEGYANEEAEKEVNSQIETLNKIKELFTQRQDILETKEFKDMKATLGGSRVSLMEDIDQQIDILNKLRSLVTERRSNREGRIIASTNNNTDIMATGLGRETDDALGESPKYKTWNSKLYDNILRLTGIKGFREVYGEIAGVIHNIKQLPKDDRDEILKNVVESTEELEMKLRRSTVYEKAGKKLRYLDAAIRGSESAFNSFITGMTTKEIAAEQVTVGNINAYIKAVQESDIKDFKGLTKEEYISFLKDMKKVFGLQSFKTELLSEEDLYKNLDNEIKTAIDIQESTDDLFAPGDEQIISIRQIIKEVTSTVHTLISLAGVTGSGKSLIVAPWVIRGLNRIGIKNEDILVTGSNKFIRENLSQSTQLERQSPLTGNDGILNRISNDALGSTKLIMIDESQMVGISNMLAIYEAIRDYNTKIGKNVKILAIGDPLQTGEGGVSFLNQASGNNTEELERGIAMSIDQAIVKPLSILYRSTISAVNNAVDMFHNKHMKVDTSNVVFYANNLHPETTDTTLYGVIADQTNDKDFIEKIKNIIDQRKDNRSRMIAVDHEKVAMYTEAFKGFDVQICDDGKIDPETSWLGRTVDEVYINLTQPKDGVYREFNSNMNTVAGRARFFVYFGNFTAKGYLDTTVGQEKTTIDHKATMTEFLKKRQQELEDMKPYLNETEKVQEVKDIKPETKVNAEQTEQTEDAQEETTEHDDAVVSETIPERTGVFNKIHTTKSFFSKVKSMLGLSKGRVIFVRSTYMKDGQELPTVLVLMEEGEGNKRVYHEIGVSDVNDVAGAQEAQPIALQKGDNGVWTNGGKNIPDVHIFAEGKIAKDSDIRKRTNYYTKESQGDDVVGTTILNFLKTQYPNATDEDINDYVQKNTETADFIVGKGEKDGEFTLHNGYTYLKIKHPDMRIALSDNQKPYYVQLNSKQLKDLPYVMANGKTFQENWNTYLQDVREATPLLDDKVMEYTAIKNLNDKDHTAQFKFSQGDVLFGKFLNGLVADTLDSKVIDAEKNTEEYFIFKNNEGKTIETDDKGRVSMNDILDHYGIVISEEERKRILPVASRLFNMERMKDQGGKQVHDWDSDLQKAFNALVKSNSMVDDVVVREERPMGKKGYISGISLLSRTGAMERNNLEFITQNNSMNKDEWYKWINDNKGDKDIFGKQKRVYSEATTRHLNEYNRLKANDSRTEQQQARLEKLVGIYSQFDNGIPTEDRMFTDYLHYLRNEVYNGQRFGTVNEDLMSRMEPLLEQMYIPITRSEIMSKTTAYRDTAATYLANTYKGSTQSTVDVTMNTAVKQEVNLKGTKLPVEQEVVPTLTNMADYAYEVGFESTPNYGKPKDDLAYAVLSYNKNIAKPQGLELTTKENITKEQILQASNQSKSAQTILTKRAAAKDDFDGAPLLRETTDEQFKPTAQSKIEAYIKKLFPNDIGRVKFLDLSDTNIWGQFKDGVIFLQQNEDGTSYMKVARHEVFHKFFREYLDNALRGELISLAQTEGNIQQGVNELMSEYYQKVEEWLANKYMDYRQYPEGFTGTLRRILDLFRDMLNFITNNTTDLEKIFRYIDRGGMKVMSSEVMGGEANLIHASRDYHAVRNDTGVLYSKFEVYKYARSYVLRGLSMYTGQDYGHDIVTPEVYEKDGIIRNAPKTFEEAVAQINIISQRQAQANVGVILEGEDILKDAALQQLLDNESYNLKQMMEDIFPSRKIKDFDAQVEMAENEWTDEIEESTPEDIVDVEEDESKGLFIQPEAGIEDPLKKIKFEQRQFMSMIAKDNQRTTFVPFKTAFKLMFNLTSNIDFSDGFEKAIKTFSERKKTSGRWEEQAVADAYLKLLQEASVKVVTVEGKQTRIPKNIRFDDKNTFVLSKEDLTLIPKESYTDQQVLTRTGTSSDFFNTIASILSVEQHMDKKVAVQMVATLYKQKYARDMVGGINTTISNLVQVDTVVAEENYGPGGATHIIRKIEGNKSKTLMKLNLQSELADIWFNHGFNIDRVNKLLKTGTEEEHMAEVRSFYKKLPIYSKTPLFISSTTDILKAISGIHGLLKTELGDELQKIVETEDSVITITPQSILNSNASGWMNTINSAFLNQSDSYAVKSSDGKIRHALRRPGTFATLIQQMQYATLNDKALPKDHRFNSSYLSDTANNQRNNIFSGSTNVHQVIHSISDFDAEKKENQGVTVQLYQNENKQQWLKRTFLYNMFTSLTQINGYRYFQPTWTVGSKRHVSSGEINFLSENNVKEALKHLIRYESERADPSIHKEYQVDNYITNWTKSYLPGQTETLHDKVELIKKKQGLHEPTGKYIKVLNDRVQEISDRLDEEADKLLSTMVDSDMLNSVDLIKLYQQLRKEEFIGEIPSGEVKTITGAALSQLTDEEKDAHRIALTNYAQPMFRLMYKNYYANSMFFNEIGVGDKAYYKNGNDLGARLSVIHSPVNRASNNPDIIANQFKAVVADDPIGVIDRQSIDTSRKGIEHTFEQVEGKPVIITDGTVYILPEMVQQLRDAYGNGIHIGEVIKGSVSNIDKNGIQRIVKCAIWEISDDLAKTNGELNELGKIRQQMRDKKVGMYIFKSAMKIGSPLNTIKAEGETMEPIRDEHIMTMQQAGFGITFDPMREVHGTTSNFNQSLALMNTNNKNATEQQEVMQLNSDLLSIQEGRFDRMYGLRNGDKTDTSIPMKDKVVDNIRRLLLKTNKGLPSEVVRILEAKTKEGYIIPVDFPTVVDKFISIFANSYKKNIIRRRFQGSDMILQAEFGMSKIKLSYKDKKGYTECALPESFKEMGLGEGDIIGFRIPSTDQHSMVLLKIKEFYPTENNVMILPREAVYYMGSDYDIDTMFIVRKNVLEQSYDLNDILLPLKKEGPVTDSYDFVEGDKFDKDIESIDGVKKHPYYALKDLHKAVVENQNEYTDFKKELGRIDQLMDLAIQNRMIDVMANVMRKEENDASQLYPINNSIIADKNWTPESGLTEPVMNALLRKGTTVREGEGVVAPIRNVNPDFANPSDDQEQHEENMSADTQRGATVKKTAGMQGLMTAAGGEVKVKRAPNNAEHTKEVDRAHRQWRKLNRQYKDLLDQVDVLRARRKEVSQELTDKMDALAKQIKTERDIFERVSNLDYTIKVDGHVYDNIGITQIDTKGKEVEIVLNKIGNRKIKHVVATNEVADAMTNVTIDNQKDPALRYINLTNKTSDIWYGFIGMRLPTELIGTIMTQPVGFMLNKGFLASQEIKNLQKKIEGRMKELGTSALKGVTLSTELLDKYIYSTKDLNNEDVGFLQAQYTVLENYDKAQRIGEYMRIVNDFVTLHTENGYPTTYAEQQDKVAKVRKIMTEKRSVDNTTGEIMARTSSPFYNLDFNRLPHAVKSFELLRDNMIEERKMVRELNDNVQGFVTEVDKLLNGAGGFGFKFDRNKNIHKDRVTKQFMEFLLAGAYKVSEEKWTSKGKNPKTFYGHEAWSQQFIDEAMELKKDNEDNIFLQSLHTAPDYNTFGKRFTFDVSLNDPNMIEEYYDAFDRLEDDVRQKFVGYAVLNYGTKFSTANFSIAIKPIHFRPVVEHFDNIMKVLLSDQGWYYFDNIKKVFSLMMSDKNINFINGTSRIYRNETKTMEGNRNVYAGEDVIDGVKVYYDKKYATTEEQGYNSYPLVINSFGKMYVKMKELDKEHVYYQLFGLSQTHKNYQYGPEVFDRGWDMNKAVLTDHRTVYTEDHTSTKVKTSKYAGYKLSVGDKVLVVTFSDRYRQQPKTGVVESVKDINEEGFVQEATIGSMEKVDVGMSDMQTREIEFVDRKKAEEAKKGAKQIATEIMRPIEKEQLNAENISNADTKAQTRAQQNIFGSKKVVKISQALEALVGNSMQGNLVKALLPYAKAHDIEIEVVDTDAFNKVTGKLSFAQYDQAEDKIYIAGQANIGTRYNQVILHEILHALTTDALWINNTKASKEFDRLYEYAKTNMDNNLYGLKNRYEFIAELYTNTQFIDALSKVKPMDGIKFKNLFQEVLDYILKFFNIIGKDMNDSLYTQAFAAGTQVLSAEKVFHDIVNESNKSMVLNFESKDTNYAQSIVDENTNNDIELINPESDTDTYYKDNTGTKYQRLTEFLHNTFSQTLSAKDWAEKKTKQEYGHLNKAYTESLMDGGKSFTYDERVQFHLNRTTFNKQLGKIKHLYMQRSIYNDEQQMYYRINARLDKAKAEFTESSRNYDFIPKIAQSIFADIGSNYFFKFAEDNASIRDKVYTELPMVSKELGWGTTIDLMIRHSNGEYTIADWKTGTQGSVDAVSNMLLKYSSDQIKLLYDTPIARAELQVMLQSFIFKSKFPDARFRRQLAVHILDNGKSVYQDVDIANNLSVIESYFKETNRTLYEDLNKRKLFDAKQYSGYSKTLSAFMRDTNEMDMSQRKDWLVQKMDAINLDLKTAPKKEELNEQLARYAEVFSQLQHTFGTDMESDKTVQGFWKKNFGNLYNVTNKRLQAFWLALEHADGLRRKEQTQVFEEYDNMINDVLVDKGIKKNRLQKVFTTYNFEQVFDFTKSWSNEPGKVGWHSPVGEQWRDKAGVDHQMSGAEIRYMTWWRENIQKLNNDVMGREMQQTTTDNVYRKTKGELINPNGMAEDFYIYYPIRKLELYQRHGIRMDGMGERMMNGLKDSFTVPLSEWNPEKTRPLNQIPLKYMGNEKIMEEENHTFDHELATKEWMKNMLNKKYKDHFVGFAAGLKQVIKYEVTNEDDATEIGKYLDAHLREQVLGVRRTSRITSQAKVVKWLGETVNEEGQVEERALSIDKVLGSVRLWTTWVTMPLKIVQPSFNTAMNLIFLNMEGLKGSIALSLNIPPEEVNYSLSDLHHGLMQWSKLQGEYMTGTYKTNKLWLAARQFDYLADGYDVRMIRKNAVIGEPTAYDTANLFATYKIGEDMSVYTILAAQMHHQKVKEGGVSMWDAYSVKDGRLEFDPNIIRGYIKNADGTYSELRGYTDREIFKLKRIYEMQQGGYRKSEQTIIQHTAFGKMLMQFKQYMPTILNNMYSGKYRDYSLADLKLVEDPMKPGENVYDYVDRINEGRALIMMKMIWSWGHLQQFDPYHFNNLSNEQKQQVIIMTQQLLIMSLAITAAMVGAAGDGDDPLDTPLGQRTKRLFMEDATQGLNPVDILRSAMTPLSAVSKGFNAIQGSMTYLTEGLIMGKKTSEGKPVGWSAVSKSIPGLTTFAEYDRYFKKSAKDSEYSWLFGYQSDRR